MNELKQLTSVFFDHEYLTDLKFSGIRVNPTAETSNRMEREGLLIKGVENGINIFGKDLKEVVGTELNFELVLKDPAFYNYSLLHWPALNEMLLCFFNYLTNETKLALSETVRNAVTTDFSVNVLPSVANDKHLFGKMSLKILQGMPAKYTITFHAKSTFWHYHIISKNLKPFMECSVVNVATGEVFDGPYQLKLANGKDALVFKSPKPIMLIDSNTSQYQLVTRYDKIKGNHKKILATLPIPSIVQPVAGSPDNVSDIFVYF